MYSVLYAVYAKEGMSPEDFADHWVNVHAAIGRTLPHVKSYRIFPVTSSQGARDHDVAGFAVVEFESKEDFDAAGASPEMQNAVDDVANFASHMAAYDVVAHTVI
jgi:uncharacterized protein (TIGR02118 family)